MSNAVSERTDLSVCCLSLVSQSLRKKQSERYAIFMYLINSRFVSQLILKEHFNIESVFMINFQKVYPIRQVFDKNSVIMLVDSFLNYKSSKYVEYLNVKIIVF